MSLCTSSALISYLQQLRSFSFLRALFLSCVSLFSLVYLHSALLHHQWLFVSSTISLSFHRLRLLSLLLFASLLFMTVVMLLILPFAGKARCDCDCEFVWLRFLRLGKWPYGPSLFLTSRLVFSLTSSLVLLLLLLSDSVILIWQGSPVRLSSSVVCGSVSCDSASGLTDPTVKEASKEWRESKMMNRCSTSYPCQVNNGKERRSDGKRGSRGAGKMELKRMSRCSTSKLQHVMMLNDDGEEEQQEKAEMGQNSLEEVGGIDYVDRFFSLLSSSLLCRFGFLFGSLSPSSSLCPYFSSSSPSSGDEPGAVAVQVVLNEDFIRATVSGDLDSTTDVDDDSHFSLLICSPRFFFLCFSFFFFSLFFHFR